MRLMLTNRRRLLICSVVRVIGNRNEHQQKLSQNDRFRRLKQEIEGTSGIRSQL
jgi:hypothetical protein